MAAPLAELTADLEKLPVTGQPPKNEPKRLANPIASNSWPESTSYLYVLPKALAIDIP